MLDYSGYMAPEYAADGYFSIKSDVFSFGILILEIISGKRSRGFYHPDQSLNLISHVSMSQKIFNSNIILTNSPTLYSHHTIDCLKKASAHITTTEANEVTNDFHIHGSGLGSMEGRKRT